MFHAVFTDEPDETVVITTRIWPLSCDRAALPEHVAVHATVTCFSENDTLVWELTCRMPAESVADAWLIVHAKRNLHVLGYFPLCGTLSTTTTRFAAQLINSQPESDISLFAVKTNDDCLNFNAWLRKINAYAACEMIKDQPDQHLMIVRTLRNMATLTGSAPVKQGNMLLSRTETAELLTRTNELRLTLAVVQWEFNVDPFANASFGNDNVRYALESRQAFYNSLPQPIKGNLEIPLDAQFPIDSECMRLIYMAGRTLHCCATGCNNCVLYITHLRASVIQCIDKNKDVLQSSESFREFLKSPRMCKDKDLFFALVIIALQLHSSSIYLPNIRRLLQLYLP